MMKLMTRIQQLLAVLLMLGLPVGTLHAKNEAPATSTQFTAKNVDKRSLTETYPVNSDASLNIVIDTSATKGKAPARNYSLGKVPRTLLLTEKNGDGNLLKALVIGSPAAQGSVIRGRPLALLIQQNGDQQQTLLIVTTLVSIYGSAQNLDEIEALTPGTIEQIKSAFKPVKATKGNKVTYTIKDRKDTLRFLGDAISDFDNTHVKESDKRPLDQDGNPQRYSWPGARNIGE